MAAIKSEEVILSFLSANNFPPVFSAIVEGNVADQLADSFCTPDAYLRMDIPSMENLVPLFGGTEGTCTAFNVKDRTLVEWGPEGNPFFVANSVQGMITNLIYVELGSGEAEVPEIYDLFEYRYIAEFEAFAENYPANGEIEDLIALIDSREPRLTWIEDGDAVQ